MNHFNPNASIVSSNPNDDTSKILIITDEKDSNNRCTFHQLVETCQMLAARENITNLRDSTIGKASKVFTPPYVDRDQFTNDTPTSIKLSHHHYLPEDTNTSGINERDSIPLSPIIPPASPTTTTTPSPPTTTSTTTTTPDQILSTVTSSSSIEYSSQQIIKSSYQDDNKIYWMDMEGLNQEEISTICRILSIHHLTYEDIISHDSTEKSEEYQHYLFVSTSEVAYSSYSNELTQSNIYLLIFKSFILVFHPLPLDCFADIITSFRYLDGSRIQSSSWVLTSTFDAINETYSTLADNLMSEVNTLDDFALREDVAQNELYVRLGRAIRKATNLLSWLFIKNDTLSSLLRNSIGEETKRHLRNIKDRVLRLQQKIKLAEELLENVNNIYISKVSLVLNEESHLLSMSMSRFTTLTFIFMPINLIAAIMGMNVRLPFMVDKYPDNLHPFAFFMTLYGVWIIGMGLYFKRLGWL